MRTFQLAFGEEELPSEEVINRIGRAALNGWHFRWFKKSYPKSRHSLTYMRPGEDGYYVGKVNVPSQPETPDEWITRLLDEAEVPK